MAMPEADRQGFWSDTPCPRPHPATVVTKARRGNREAANTVLQLLRGLSSWGGITREEMTELAAGDRDAVKARRRWKAKIRTRYYRNRARYTRWSVQLEILLRPGSHLSCHEEFTDKDEARQWAERFIDNPAALSEYLDGLNAKRSWPGDDYVMSESTEVRTIVLMRERQAYPWHWIDGLAVWRWEAVEWYWECEKIRSITESGQASWKITIGGKVVAPLPAT